MSVILQEEDLQKINYELERIRELSKSAVKDDAEAIKAAFLISMKAEFVHKYLNQKEEVCQENS